MKPDSTAVLTVNLPQTALPAWVLAMLLAGWFVVILVLILKAGQFKKYAEDFPTHTATVIVALAGIVATTPVVLARVALGLNLPDGTDGWLVFLGALAGVTVGGLAVKRFSSPDYQDAKTAREVAKAAASAPQVSAGQGSTVNTEATSATATFPVVTAAPASATPAAIRESLGTLATRQQFPAPDIEGSGD